MLILVYWPLLSLKAQLTVTFLVVVFVLPDGLISSDTFASSTSYYRTDCIWTVMFIFYRDKHVFFHKSQFPSELLFLLYQAQASKPSAWMVLFLTVLPSQSFVFHSYFKIFFHFPVILLLDTFAGTLAILMHSFTPSKTVNAVQHMAVWGVQEVRCWKSEVWWERRVCAADNFTWLARFK